MKYLVSVISDIFVECDSEREAISIAISNAYDADGCESARFACVEEIEDEDY